MCGACFCSHCHAVNFVGQSWDDLNYAYLYDYGVAITEYLVHSLRLHGYISNNIPVATYNIFNLIATLHAIKLVVYLPVAVGGAAGYG